MACWPQTDGCLLWWARAVAQIQVCPLCQQGVLLLLLLGSPGSDSSCCRASPSVAGAGWGPVSLWLLLLLCTPKPYWPGPRGASVGVGAAGAVVVAAVVAAGPEGTRDAGGPSCGGVRSGSREVLLLCWGVWGRRRCCC